MCAFFVYIISVSGAADACKKLAVLLIKLPNPWNVYYKLHSLRAALMC
jgi:hypothetical protein